MSQTIAAALGQTELFSSLDRAGLDRLAGRCAERSYGAGEVVFLRGDHGSCMYVVASGCVEVSLAVPDGGDILLAVLGTHATFGELDMVDSGGRVATVRARAASRLILVPRPAVVALVDSEPGVARALLLALAAMVRRLDEQVSDAALLSLPMRVEKYLGAAATRGRPPAQRTADDDAYVAVDIPLTQADLARQVGGSRQQVNRILMGLETSGAIQRLGHRIVGVRPELLRGGSRHMSDSSG